jgi:two-component system response regulator MprA
MIFIVDDEPGIREALGRFLVQRGFDVSTAANPTEALLMLQLARPAAMILDIRMPDPTGRMRSGLDLLRFLRGLSEYATLPVLVLTGHLLTEEEQAILHACRAEVQYKPLELHRLSEHVAALSPPSAGHGLSSD